MKKIHEGEQKDSCSETTQKCNLCGKFFLTTSKLRSHVRYVHEGERKDTSGTPQMCKLCDKFFSNPHKVRRHERRFHEQSMQLKCKHPDCTFGTQDKRSLKNHMTRHTGEKAYTCHLCDRAFSLNHAKELHIRNIHEEARRFRCDYVDCTYGSEYRRQLETHKIKHTASKIQSQKICSWEKLPIQMRPVELLIQNKTKKELCSACNKTRNYNEQGPLGSFVTNLVTKLVSNVVMNCIWWQI